MSVEKPEPQQPEIKPEEIEEVRKALAEDDYLVRLTDLTRKIGIERVASILRSATELVQQQSEESTKQTT